MTWDLVGRERVGLMRGADGVNRWSARSKASLESDPSSNLATERSALKMSRVAAQNTGLTDRRHSRALRAFSWSVESRRLNGIFDPVFCHRLIAKPRLVCRRADSSSVT